ncbi:MAG: hypothetical protein ACI4QR_07420 [Eubacteriales bacterium]
MGKGKSIAGFVLALFGLLMAFIPILSLISLPISIVGLVLSVVGGKKLSSAGLPHGLATAGMVVGIIAVVFSSVTFFTCGVCTLCAIITADGIREMPDLSDMEDIFKYFDSANVRANILPCLKNMFCM